MAARLLIHFSIKKSVKISDKFQCRNRFNDFISKIAFFSNANWEMFTSEMFISVMTKFINDYRGSEFFSLNFRQSRKLRENANNFGVNFKQTLPNENWLHSI